MLLSQSISIAVSFSVMLLLFTIGMQGAPFYAIFITSFLSYFTIWGGLRYLTLAMGDGDSLIPAFPGEMFLKNKVTDDIRQGNAALNQELERLRMQQAYDRKEFVANEEAEARKRPPVRASLKNDLPVPVSKFDLYKGYKDDLEYAVNVPFAAIAAPVKAAQYAGNKVYDAAKGVKNILADGGREVLAFAGDAARHAVGIPAYPDRMNGMNGMYARERERAEAERFERYRKENLEREDRQRKENMERDDRWFNGKNQQQRPQQQQQQRPQPQSQFRPVDPGQQPPPDRDVRSAARAAAERRRAEGKLYEDAIRETYQRRAEDGERARLRDVSANKRRIEQERDRIK